MFDAAVIGSGPNGLAAAITLARAGRSVVVHERSDSVGGSARSAELTLPGYLHDVCSAAHPMAAAGAFFNTLPLREHGLEWIRPEHPVGHALDPGERAIIQHHDLHATAQEVCDPGYVRALEPFVERYAELLQDGTAPLGIPDSPVLMARFGMRALLPSTTLAGLLFSSRRARALFAGHACHSCLPLSQPPSAAIGLMLHLAAHAVSFPMPRGGAGAITAAMASYLETLGGRIELNSEITHIGQVQARQVFFNTSPRALASIARDALPSGYLRALSRFKRGPGVFKVDYALSSPIPWTDARLSRCGTVHLGGDLEALSASEAAVWRGEHPERPFVLLTQPTQFDPGRAPEGGHIAWAYVHTPNGSTRDQSEVITAAIEAHAPGFRDCVRAQHCMNNADFEAYNPNYVGGDINGGANTLDQLFTRPVARFAPWTTPNPDVFLCSASTPPGGGVHGLGGHHAALAALAQPRRLTEG